MAYNQTIKAVNKMKPQMAQKTQNLVSDVRQCLTQVGGKPAINKLIQAAK